MYVELCLRVDEGRGSTDATKWTGRAPMVAMGREAESQTELAQSWVVAMKVERMGGLWTSSKGRTKRIYRKRDVKCKKTPKGLA